MTRIRLLVAHQESQRCQYFDITLYCCSISLEYNRKVRNWCWLFANSVEYPDPLRCERSEQISRIFKGQPQFGGKLFPTVQLTSTIKRSLKKRFRCISAYIEVFRRFLQLLSSITRELLPENERPATRSCRTR